MKPTIHILATCRNPELFRGTTLIFDTLRTGFPTAEVHVYLNDLLESPDHLDQMERVKQLALDKGCVVHRVIGGTIHHKWIHGLLRDHPTEPFIILDTDMVFWKNCEDWNHGDAALSGRFIPEFYDQFTKCVTRARLHGSFLYFNPANIAARLVDFKHQFPDTPFNPLANVIDPIVIPGTPHSFFHDTCCLLYQAIGGKAFSVGRLECYDHLNCGTISDIVGPHLTDIRLREAHFAVFENPALAKGVWRDQEKYYLAHQPYE